MNDQHETPKTALELIAAEHERTRNVEGFTAESDDDTNGLLAQAAACYARHASLNDSIRDDLKNDGWLPDHWPWGSDWWKPGQGNDAEHRIRELVKAGNLIVSEIERLQRSQAQP